MYKFLLLFAFLGLSLNTEASNFLKQNFNESNMTLSDTYRYIVSKNNINDFIKNNSMNRKENKNIQKYLNKNYSKLCYDIYYGTEFLVKNHREGEVCLKYALQEGYFNAALYLSEIKLKEKNIIDSAVWSGIAAGLGLKIKDTDIYQDYIISNKDIKKAYLKGIHFSGNLSFKKLKNKSLIENMYFDFFNYELNEHILNNNFENKFIYQSLLNGEYKKFADVMSESTDNVSKLILLSHIKNKDWKSLIEYCDKYMENYFKNYCFKTLYKNKKESSAVFNYIVLSFFNYQENNDKISLKNTFNMLGFAFEDDIEILKIMTNKFLNKVEEKDLTEAMIHFNNGRIFNRINKIG